MAILLQINVGDIVYYKTFIPAWNKAQFISWANARYPGNNSKHNKMKIKQLIAIYINAK